MKSIKLLAGIFFFAISLSTHAKSVQLNCKGFYGKADFDVVGKLDNTGYHFGPDIAVGNSLRLATVCEYWSCDVAYVVLTDDGKLSVRINSNKGPGYTDLYTTEFLVVESNQKIDLDVMNRSMALFVSCR